MSVRTWLEQLFHAGPPAPPPQVTDTEAETLRGAAERVRRIQAEIRATDAAVRFVEERLRARGRLPDEREH